MAKLQIETYTNALHSASTVTLGNYNATYPVNLDRLYLIVDVTKNIIVYNFADSTVATATISSNNVITLSAVPAGVADADVLMILYEHLTWTYVSSSLSSTGTVTGVGRCGGIRVYANGTDGSFNVNGGNTITVRSGTGVDVNPEGSLTAPVVNWVSGSLDIIVEGWM